MVKYPPTALDDYSTHTSKLIDQNGAIAKKCRLQQNRSYRNWNRSLLVMYFTWTVMLIFLGCPSVVICFRHADDLSHSNSHMAATITPPPTLNKSTFQTDDKKQNIITSSTLLREDSLKNSTQRAAEASSSDSKWPKRGPEHDRSTKNSSSVSLRVIGGYTSSRNTNNNFFNNRPISPVFEPSPIQNGFNNTSTISTYPSFIGSAIVVNEEEYQRRKQEWAAKYATLNGLRQTFGSNRNKIWGDLDPTTTRKLYKTLLPTALCELVIECGVRPEELAPLAYEARKAAKLYARERCYIPARIGASLYDGYRQWKNYGKFQPAGMSYDQIWDKYERISYQETKQKQAPKQDGGWKYMYNNNNNYWTEEDIVTRTCMKIIESSTRTNPRIDQMTLRKRPTKDRNDEKDRQDLKKIAQTLEDDVRKLLDPYNNNDNKALIGRKNKKDEIQDTESELQHTR